MEIVEYSSKYAREVADLFYKSVHSINAGIYSEEQKSAWAPSPINYASWEKRLELKRPYLLLINDQLAGFIELESDGHIDCAYVSPIFQRKGVATTMLKYVVNKAKNRGLKLLYVEASIVAKPLFEKFAFVSEKENKVIRNGIVLNNYSMHIKLQS